MIRKTHAVVFTSIVAATLTTTAAQAAQLDQERRVDAHRAVEQVLWDHRVWPDSNPGPKPPLHSVLPDSALRARVDDVLRKSNALATLWKRPIGNLELQAELDRMVRGSRDPGALGAMFDALGRDPVLVAETIARPALVDRLIRSWYANDPRFHDAERREAERGFAAATTPEDLARIAPLYETTTWTRDDTSTASDGSSPGTISLDAADWNDILERIRQRFARSGAEGVGELPIGRMSPLRETDAAYSATVVLSKSTRTVRVAVASWPKTSFDTWWASERSNQPPILSELRTMEPALVLSREPASPSVPSCADDAWTRTGTGAPEGRYSHTAVWTGSEMIVWGGLAGFYVSFHEANTGGRYAPATDTWSPLSTIGAPTPRIDHVAIWTGSRMVVWGGRQLLSSNVFFDTGGRYDPVTDSWTPTSTVGAPSPRVPLVAVWTGSRTVVWGDAYTFAGATGSGGRYDPVADSWSPTTQVDAPQQDYSSPGAVWTGSQLIVWPGKRYDPVADTWSPIASADAPALRGFHCQVRTNGSMC